VGRQEATATRWDESLRILAFGTYDTTTHPRSGILLDGLRLSGDEVVEANIPLGLTTAQRVELLAKPWLLYRLVIRLLWRWTGVLNRAGKARRTGPFDAIFVGYMGHFDVVLARARFPRDTILLDLLVLAADTARDREHHSGLRLPLLELVDALAVWCADIVIVDTVEDRELLGSRARSKVEVAAVGASESWFAAGAQRPQAKDDAPLRIVFFGLFTPLQGSVVISEALARLADTEDIVATMIGRGQDWAAARRSASSNNRITWIDWIEPASLPSMVAGHDVCLGIFGATPKAQRVVPNKVFEGAAAGCAIITSDTAPQRRALGDAAIFVGPADARSLAETLRELSEDRDRVARLGAAARTLALSNFTAGTVVGPLRRRLLGTRPG
jgi:glycosyltransferase involved in cell wall biosynthesis